jgi:hypothetical protein
MDSIDLELIKATAYWEGVWKTFEYIDNELGIELWDTELANEAKLELGL